MKHSDRFWNNMRFVTCSFLYLCRSLFLFPLAPPAGRKKERWIFHEDGEPGEAAEGGVWKCTVRFGPQAAVAFDIKESLHVGFVYGGKMVRNVSLIHIQAEQHEPNMHIQNSIYVYICMQMAGCIHNSCHKLQGTTKRPPTPHKRLTAIPLWKCFGNQIYTEQNNSTGYLRLNALISVCLQVDYISCVDRSQNCLHFLIKSWYILVVWYNNVLKL